MTYIGTFTATNKIFEKSFEPNLSTLKSYEKFLIDNKNYSEDRKKKLEEEPSDIMDVVKKGKEKKKRKKRKTEIVKQEEEKEEKEEKEEEVEEEEEGIQTIEVQLYGHNLSNIWGKRLSYKFNDEFSNQKYKSHITFISNDKFENLTRKPISIMIIKAPETKGQYNFFERRLHKFFDQTGK